MRQPLKTLKGSRIQRSKYGVGKLIGGSLYLHKDYATRVIPYEDYDLALQVLFDNYPDYEFNVVKYDPKNSKISFMECPDFDTAREPIIGDYVVVDIFNETAKMGHSNTIYHHKWLFVDDDYTGFDVDDSYEWSSEWLSKLTEPADGTNQTRWLSQLHKFGLK